MDWLRRMAQGQQKYIRKTFLNHRERPPRRGGGNEIRISDRCEAKRRDSEKIAQEVLESNGFLVKKEHHKNGWPDFRCVGNDKDFYLEVKRSHDDLTGYQVKTIGELLSEGEEVKLGLLDMDDRRIEVYDFNEYLLREKVGEYEQEVPDPPTGVVGYSININLGKEEYEKIEKLGEGENLSPKEVIEIFVSEKIENINSHQKNWP